MNIKSYTISFVLAFLLCLPSGCTKGKGPLVMVQVCLGDEQNVAIFKDVISSIARSQHMNFWDGSAAVQRDLTERNSNPNYQLLYIGIDGKDDLHMEASNFGLSAYEVAVGFAQGANPAEAHRFADTVVAALKKKWTVYTVPPDRGALPLKACQTTSAEPNGG